MSLKQHFTAMIVLAVMAPTTQAEIINNSMGIGGDAVVRRGGATENDGLLRIKTASGDTETNGLDRIGLLRFDLSLLSQPITEALVQLEMPRGAATGQAGNTFDAGNTLYLYGIPNGSPYENFDEGSITFGEVPYLTGAGSVTDPRPASDLTANGVNDELVPLLATYTFTATWDAGHRVNFMSEDLVSFLQADSTGIASFLLAVSQSDIGKTAVFTSSTGTEGTPLPPTLRTNTDVLNTDFGGSGSTTLDDFHILRDNFLTGTTNAEGDANFDGVVNHQDFFLWRTAYLAGGGSLSDFTFAVPEPATGITVLVMSVLASSLFSRCQRQP